MRYSDHGRGGIHRKSSRRAAAGERPPSPRPRRPLDRRDGQHPPPQGRPGLLLHDRVGRLRVHRRRAGRRGRRRLPPRRRGRRRADRRQPGPHDRDQRALHRDRPGRSQQEAEAGLHRLHQRGLRQEHRAARSARTGICCSARPPPGAGPTPAPRPSTSTWRSPTARSGGCRW